MITLAIYCACAPRDFIFYGVRKPLISWDKIIAPKDKGGLGVINLKMQNQVLLMKHLHKFYGRADIPWVDLIWKTHYCSGRVPHFHPNKGSFWWKDIARLSIHFRGIASPIAGDDLSFVIWQDVWNNMILKMEFPSLYSFARRKNCSLAQFMQHQNLLDNFQSPLSSDAQGKFVIFQDKIRTIQGMMQGKDR